MAQYSKFDRVSAWAWFAVFGSLSTIVYTPLLSFSVSDFNGFVKPWLDYIRSHGGFAAMADPFSEYAPPYLYLLATGASLGLPVGDQVLVKLINLPFVLIITLAIFNIVRHFELSRNAAAAAAGGTLVLPTLGVNAFVWGQADTVYVAFLLLAALFVLKQRPTWAVAAFALAVSTKLQGIFLAPFVLAMVLAGRIPWRCLWAAPAVYAATILPAALIGRPLRQLLTIYLVQGRFYNMLSMNSPNFYFFLDFFFAASRDWQVYKKITLAGLALSSAAGAVISLAGLSRRPISDRTVLLIATVSMIVMPYVLPKMHDRFFLGADTFSYALAWAAPQFAWVAVAVQLSSLLSYGPEFSLFVLPGGSELWRWAVVVGGAINTVVVVYLLRALWRELGPVGGWRAIGTGSQPAVGQ
jgi:Gpi18-like mannosyltransferase